jgi:hypothetical protein
MFQTDTEAHASQAMPPLLLIQLPQYKTSTRISNATFKKSLYFGRQHENTILSFKRKQDELQEI